MGIERRVPLIRQIEELRGSTVICYLTSLRPNVPAAIASDQVRVFFDQLHRLPARPVEKLDIFLCSNGGDGVVPWRLVPLFREFAKSFNVLIPYRAYSAASLIALGADEIVMHPFAELGPIDPTVSNAFNPKEDGTGRPLGISVEDVKAYVQFIKETVGITHEDELVRAIEVLAQKVHPLALGNVERFLAQSRMIAKKILKTHAQSVDAHAIDEIVENMASKLYFHGHPINRREAKEDLRLKVCADLPPELEVAMWNLYLDYEEEFQNSSIFDPTMELWSQLAARSAVVPPPGAAQPPPHVDAELTHAIIESPRLSSVFKSNHRFQVVGQVQPGQLAVHDMVLSQGWINRSIPTEEETAERSVTAPPGAPSGEDGQAAAPGR